MKKIARTDYSNNAPVYEKEKYFCCLLLEEYDQIMDET